MVNINDKSIRKNYIRLAILILVCAGFVIRVQLARVGHAQVEEKEPIAYIGHGAMFDQSGKEVKPSLAFIRAAQAWYRAALVKKLTKAQQLRFNQLEQGVTKGLALDGQSQLVLNSYLLDSLLDAVKVENRDRIRGKNNLLKILLKTKLPETADAILPQSTEPFIFNINPELIKRMAAKSKAKRPVVKLLTSNGGVLYRNECLANGVPIPPDFGPGSAWVSQGLIPQSKLFIVAGSGAEVLTYQSSTPAGMCVALPRFDPVTNIVTLDGVICLGTSTSKACFWDNEKNGIPFNFTRGDAVPFSSFGGGTELLASAGGVCSDCHAGENPYIIHPDPSTILGGLASLGLPTFANTFHQPIVRTGDTSPWPDNVAPMNAPPSCVGCHGTAASKGFAGRFPHLSTALPGYCGTILAQAITRTMPPSAPGSLAGNPEMTALQAWCGSAASGDAAGRGDPHITTFNSVNYDFQSAGEFTYLRDGGGLEIQVRQTPIATASIVGPNPHTGLTSCVSVNTAVAARVGGHRVTYQPSSPDAQARNVMELRVDGKLTRVGPLGINLSGGRIVKSLTGNGIEILFPDKTRLIAVSNFWASQQKWYLNVDVVNTRGREGIMGAITSGNWLPGLPDGTTLGAIPSSLHQRYSDLNQKFADAWRVEKSTSLFDYAPGTSTETFTDRAWPPENPPCIIQGSSIPPAKPMDAKKAQEICSAITNKNMKSQCVFDVTVTGEAGFAKNYLVTQRLRQRNNVP